MPDAKAAPSRSLVHVFAEALADLGPFSPQPHLVVALSGGADSLALTLLAQEWAQAQDGRITALTIDHGLRPESAAEAMHVQAQMAALGIQHHILTPAHADVSNNLQEAARQWRYDALADWCLQHDVLHCLIAHHADDQRETVALHRARGDTADGEAGMAALRNYRGIRFLRPLLAIEKEMLRDYLQQRGQSWIEDPSNQNQNFARVRMRQVLQHDDAARCELSMTTTTQGKARAARDEALAHAAAASVTVHPAGFADLSHAAWCALAPELATQLLADLLTTISGNTHRPRANETRRLAEALRSDFTRRTLHGCEISQQQGMVRIAREYARVAPLLILSGQGTALWDNRFHITYALPPHLQLTLAALGTFPKSEHPKGAWPRATPAIGHLDRLVQVPYIDACQTPLPGGARVTVGFAPAKPLAAAPFWWLKE